MFPLPGVHGSFLKIGVLKNVHSRNALKSAFHMAGQEHTRHRGSYRRKHSSGGSESPSTDEKTLFKRFKEDFGRYWYVMLPIHISTSFGYFLGFYYMSKSGVSPVALLELCNLPDSYIQPIRDSAASHAAVGYAGYKMITPLRYLTTIGVTGVVVRNLAAKGMLKPMPSFEEFKTNIVDKFRQRKF